MTPRESVVVALYLFGGFLDEPQKQRRQFGHAVFFVAKPNNLTIKLKSMKMKTIIQFPHPGREHTAKSGTKWNTSIHKRKYMKVKGLYLKNLSSKPIDDTVYFWGEWEASSSVTPIVGNTPPFAP